MKTALSICTILLSLFASTTMQSLRAQQPNQDTTQATSQPPQPLGELGWVKVPIDTNLYVVLGYISKDTCYAVNAASYYRSLDGGQTWERVSWAIPISGGIGFVDAKNGYVATGTTHTAYRTTDGGQTWTSADDKDQLVTLVYPVTKDTCFLSGSNNASRTTDGGKTWSVTFIPATGINGIAFADSRHGIVVGNVQAGPLPQHHEQTAGCFTTSDAGQTWVQQYTGAPSDFQSVAYTGNTTVIAAEALSKIRRSLDGGKSWVLVDSEQTGVHLSGISVHGRRGYSVGSKGVILGSSDSGVTWQPQNSTTTSDLFSVKAFDDTLALAAGDSGIFRTTTGGKEWVHVFPRSSQGLNQSNFPEPSTGIVRLEFTLPEMQHVSLTVTDITGRVALRLASGKLESKGNHTVTVDGSRLPAGVYTYTIQTERYSASGKFTIVR